MDEEQLYIAIMDGEKLVERMGCDHTPGKGGNNTNFVNGCEECCVKAVDIADSIMDGDLMPYMGTITVDQHKSIEWGS